MKYFDIGKVPSEELEIVLQCLNTVNELTLTSDPSEADDDKHHFFAQASVLQKYLSLFQGSNYNGFPVDLLRCENLQEFPLKTRINLLSNNYVAILPMLQLWNCYENDFVDTSGEESPIWYGAIAPRYSMPWGHLFVASEVGSGVPAMFCRRGTRVKILPHAFRVRTRIWFGQKIS